MPVDPPPVIETIPPDPPSLGSPSTFPTLATAFASWLVKLHTYAAALATWAETTANAAETSANNAATSANTATTASNSVPWVSAAAYSEFDQAISLVDYTSYIAITTHSGETTDPSLDAVNWKSYVPDAFAPKESPILTGTPTAPTPAIADNSTLIATTAYVQSELARYTRQAISEAEVTTDSAAVIFELTGHEAYQLVITGVSGANNVSNYLIIEFGDSVSTFYTATYSGSLRAQQIDFSAGVSNGIRISRELIFDDASNIATNPLIVVNILPSVVGDFDSTLFGRGNRAQYSEEFGGKLDYDKLNNPLILKPVSHIRIRADDGDIAKGKFFLYPLAGDTV